MGGPEGGLDDEATDDPWQNFCFSTLDPCVSISQLAVSKDIELCTITFFRDMWTPDVVFENQVTLDRAMSAIKNESNSVLLIKTLDCTVATKSECQDLNLTGSLNGTRLLFKQTVNVEVNCPDMEFGRFPFDTQVCSFLVKDLKLKETKDSALKNFKWETPHLSGAHGLTSPEYDINVERPSVTGRE